MSTEYKLWCPTHRMGWPDHTDLRKYELDALEETVRDKHILIAMRTVPHVNVMFDLGMVRYYLPEFLHVHEDCDLIIQDEYGHMERRL